MCGFNSSLYASVYAKAYIKKIESGQVKDFYKPDWKYMTSKRLAYNAFADMYLLKKQIMDSFKGNKNSQKNINASLVPLL